MRYNTFTLRGTDDFPHKEVTPRDVRPVGRIAWEKWGTSIQNHSLSDVLALVYAEGVYHGHIITVQKAAMFGLRQKDDQEPEYWSG
jgi:hypothetical protein